MGAALYVPSMFIQQLNVERVGPRLADSICSSLKVTVPRKSKEALLLLFFSLFSFLFGVRLVETNKVDSPGRPLLKGLKKLS